MEVIEGKVIYVNHEKEFVSIEYIPKGKGKAKTINGNVGKALQAKWLIEKRIKKVHQFSVNDLVRFNIELSQRGDKNIATNIQFLTNESLDVILQQASANKTFTGYIKIVDDKYFIKEINSYFFFPLIISKWQQDFTAADLNTPQEFALVNPERREKAAAILLKNKYKKEYIVAQRLYNNKEIIKTKVVKVTAFGVYVNVVDNVVIAKMPDNGKLRLNQEINIKINFLSPTKIGIEYIAE